MLRSASVIDGHSHLFQDYAPCGKLKKSVKELKDFEKQKKILLEFCEEMGIIKIQIMPQEMTRVQKCWLGSNQLAADIQQHIPEKIIAFAAAEPLDEQNTFNKLRFEEVKEAIIKRNLKGLLLTPPYGHYYSNDKAVYPFYELAMELDIPIYFHHSHMFIEPKYCPLKYARIWLLDDVIIDFPDLRINVEHMGYPWTEELLSIMSRSPNVYTDIAQFISPYPPSRGRLLLLARNLAMARDYGVLDRVFYGSDYVGEDVNEYCNLVQREVRYLIEGLNKDMEKLGYEPLSEKELEGILWKNVLKLWNINI